MSTPHDKEMIMKIVQQKMGTIETLFHAMMMLCTLGAWTPVYRHRKSKLRRTSLVG